MKRIFDILFAAIILLLTLPVSLIVALVIFVSMGSPILFVQQRPGRKGVIFNVYKFRTMSCITDATGAPLDDEYRLTPVGGWLRRLSLDELPQLYNVLIGNMSIVGPRPLLVEYLPLYSEQQMRRHHVKPGITGWAQVNGRNAVSWDKRFELDLWYVDNRSFLLDIKIIMLTLIKVLRRSDVSEEGHVTMSKFTGSN